MVERGANEDDRDGGRRMSRHSLVSTDKEMMKKRSADRKLTPYARTRGSANRPKRNNSHVDEEVGDFIVVDTGAVDIREAEDDDNPKPASASVGSDATGAILQGDGTAVQTKHQKIDICSGATQMTQGTLLVLDSGESQQMRVKWPSISMLQSASANGSSSGLADVHNAEWSPPLRNAPIDHRPSKPIRLPPSSHELSTPGTPALERFQPNPNTLPVTRETEQHPSESSTPSRIDKHPQSILVAE